MHPTPKLPSCCGLIVALPPLLPHCPSSAAGSGMHTFARPYPSRCAAIVHSPPQTRLVLALRVPRWQSLPGLSPSAAAARTSAASCSASAASCSAAATRTSASAKATFNRSIWAASWKLELLAWAASTYCGCRGSTWGILARIGISGAFMPQPHFCGNGGLQHITIKCMYICMHACMHVCMYLHTCTRI